jgi:hypothetical protein
LSGSLFFIPPPLVEVMIGFNLGNISMFISKIPGIEKYMANRPSMIAKVILAQILVTLTLVGIFS